MDHTDQPNVTPEPEADRTNTPAAEPLGGQSSQLPLSAQTEPSAPSRARGQWWRTSTRHAASERDWSRLLPQIVALVVAATIVVGLVAVVRSAHTLPSSGTSSSGGLTVVTPQRTHSTTSGTQLVAPDFTLPTLSGAPFHLASQRGHVVVLYFMSTTCVPCVQGSYFVAEAMHEAHVPGAQALAIDMNPGDTSADVVAFAHTAGVSSNASLQWAIDSHLTVSGSYGVLMLGTVYVIDGQGHMVYESDGSVALGPLVQAMHSHA